MGSNWYGRAKGNYWHRNFHNENSIAISQQHYSELQKVTEHLQLQTMNNNGIQQSTTFIISLHPPKRIETHSAIVCKCTLFVATSTLCLVLNSKFTASWKKSWINYFVQLLGTKSYGIKYSDSHSNNSNDTKLLHGFFHDFSDAAHTNSDNYKSIGGYVFIAAGLITWCSKKRMFTTLSTTDAKYSALSEAVCEAYSIRNLYK